MTSVAVDASDSNDIAIPEGRIRRHSRQLHATVCHWHETAETIGKRRLGDVNGLGTIARVRP